MRTRRLWPLASCAAMAGVVAGFAVPASTAGSQPSTVLTTAAGNERPVPRLVGLPLSRAEKVIAAWGYSSYGIGQEPAPGRGGIVIAQYPPADSMAVPASTNFYLTEGVSYRVTAHLTVATCLGWGPGVGSTSEAQVGPYPRVRTVPEDFVATSPGDWRAFGIPALIAPAKWRCTGFVAEDGGNNFTVVPPGEIPPSPTKDEASERSPVPEIAVVGEPACQGCAYSIACAYFPGSRDDGTYTEPCRIPAGEQYRRLNANVVDFTDPPGVKGTGEPSGGADPALGALVYKPHSAVMLTCVLPLGEASTCTVAIRAFTAYETASDPVGDAPVAPYKLTR